MRRDVRCLRRFGRFAIASTIFVGSLAMATSAFATQINIDFGFTNPPSSSFGAASGQTGPWNNVTTLGLTSALVDTDGNATSVDLTVVASTMIGLQGSGGSADFASLMDDNFYGEGTPWSVTLTGLSNGLYTLYLYDPFNTIVGTGSGTANGVAFSSINSSANTTSFIQGTNYLQINNVTVAGGTLAIAATGGANNFSGLAGIQLVPSAAVTNPVPEPASLTLLGTGLLAAWRARKRIA